MACGCYLFPFEIVPKGSNVVIYGAGNVGTSYVRQILQTGYCNISAWVDKSYEHKTNRYLEVLPVEEIHNVSFDYIIVSVAGPNLGLQIVRQLTEDKIDDRKIIFEERRYLPYEESDVSLDDVLMDEKYLIELVEGFKKKQFRAMDYFLNIYRDINDHEQADSIRDELFSKIKSCLRIVSDVESKEILLRLLFLFRRFDTETMQIAISTANGLDDPSRKYWMLSNIGIFEFLYPDSVYEEFYIDKRKIYADIAEGFMKGKSIPIHDMPKKKRIVILAQYLRGLDESLTQFVVMYANELAKTEYEVHIVLEEQFLYYYGEAMISPYGATINTSTRWEETIDTYLNEDIIVHFSVDKPIKERFYESICEVAKINPTFILDMCAKHSFLSAELYKHFPVICVSTGHNCNGALFHKYICRGKDLCIEANKRFHSVGEDQMVELPIGTVFPEAKFTYKREDYGFCQDDFLIVIVGRRLGKEITDDLSDCILKLIRSYSKMKLLLVGSKPVYREKMPGFSR